MSYPGFIEKGMWNVSLRADSRTAVHAWLVGAGVLFQQEPDEVDHHSFCLAPWADLAEHDPCAHGVAILPMIVSKPAVIRVVDDELIFDQSAVFSSYYHVNLRLHRNATNTEVWKVWMEQVVKQGRAFKAGRKHKAVEHEGVVFFYSDGTVARRSRFA